MEQTVLASINFLNGLVVGYICITRLAVTHDKVLPSIRLKYTMLLVGSLAYGNQPMLFSEWPTIAGTFFMVCVTVGLVAGFDRWKYGPPKDTVMQCIKP